ncbi:N-acetyltransferase [Sphingomonas sp. BGYR3]|uniref:GNAT family N-acetyltransferase n=1 Tax=Sphingomonas sp. BGYR3 TaxID=2975483 RepID=UPI0021A79891|nr:N-acetyltransferase [Sphingomonas sp. BGYR3]MDG5487076.1 N-acetyltransferase [Sphingomonas sp. BGYR3]
MTVSALSPLSDFSDVQVDALLDRAFGSDRRNRTAYRVRQGSPVIEAFSLGIADADGTLIGSIQAWPVALALDGGGNVPMTMVGPVAVDPGIQGRGLGQRLMTACLDAAGRSDLPGADALMLIGDPEYYGRFHGFSDERTGEWRLPGPFERRRLLARGTGVPTGAGMVIARTGIR